MQLVDKMDGAFCEIGLSKQYFEILFNFNFQAYLAAAWEPMRPTPVTQEMVQTAIQEEVFEDVLSKSQYIQIYEDEDPIQRSRFLGRMQDVLERCS